MLMRLALVLMLSSGFAVLPVAGHFHAEAATAKKKTKKYPEMTSEQRSKYMELARQVCRKKYGAVARVHHIDWSTRKIWCAQNW